MAAMTLNSGMTVGLSDGAIEARDILIDFPGPGQQDAQRSPVTFLGRQASFQNAQRLLRAGLMLTTQRHILRSGPQVMDRGTVDDRRRPPTST
jgi:hypothetical protein